MKPDFVRKARTALQMGQQEFAIKVCGYEGEYAYATVSKLEAGVIEASGSVQKLIQHALDAAGIKL